MSYTNFLAGETDGVCYNLVCSSWYAFADPQHYCRDPALQITPLMTFPPS